MATIWGQAPELRACSLCSKRASDRSCCCRSGLGHTSSATLEVCLLLNQGVSARGRELVRLGALQRSVQWMSRRATVGSCVTWRRVAHRLGSGWVTAGVQAVLDDQLRNATGMVCGTEMLRNRPRGMLRCPALALCCRSAPSAPRRQRGQRGAAAQRLLLFGPRQMGLRLPPPERGHRQQRPQSGRLPLPWGPRRTASRLWALLRRTRRGLGLKREPRGRRRAVAARRRAAHERSGSRGGQLRIGPAASRHSRSRGNPGAQVARRSLRKTLARAHRRA